VIETTARAYPRGGRGAWLVTGLPREPHVRVMPSEAAAWDLVARVKALVKAERVELEQAEEAEEADVKAACAVPRAPRGVGRGRPAVGPVMQVRTPAELREGLRVEAEARGVTVSGLVREFCETGLMKRPA
jgi:hypothetical protein